MRFFREKSGVCFYFAILVAKCNGDRSSHLMCPHLILGLEALDGLSKIIPLLGLEERDDFGGLVATTLYFLLTFTLLLNRKSVFLVQGSKERWKAQGITGWIVGCPVRDVQIQSVMVMAHKETLNLWPRFFAKGSRNMQKCRFASSKRPDLVSRLCLLLSENKKRVEQLSCAYSHIL